MNDGTEIMLRDVREFFSVVVYFFSNFVFLSSSRKGKGKREKWMKINLYTHQVISSRVTHHTYRTSQMNRCLNLHT